MEGQDEKPPGPLKACTQDSLLPQEIIIKVEGEDAGSLAIPSQRVFLGLFPENCIEEEEITIGLLILELQLFLLKPQPFPKTARTRASSRSP
ncbi:zinc finger protein 180 [Callospermophilus lateralis]